MWTSANEARGTSHSILEKCKACGKSYWVFTMFQCRFGEVGLHGCVILAKNNAPEGCQGMKHQKAWTIADPKGFQQGGRSHSMSQSSRANPLLRPYPSGPLWEHLSSPESITYMFLMVFAWWSNGHHIWFTWLLFLTPTKQKGIDRRHIFFSQLEQQLCRRFCSINSVVLWWAPYLACWPPKHKAVARLRFGHCRCPGLELRGMHMPNLSFSILCGNINLVHGISLHHSVPFCTHWHIISRTEPMAVRARATSSWTDVAWHRSSQCRKLWQTIRWLPCLCCRELLSPTNYLS